MYSPQDMKLVEAPCISYRNDLASELEEEDAKIPDAPHQDTSSPAAPEEAEKKDIYHTYLNPHFEAGEEEGGEKEKELGRRSVASDSSVSTPEEEVESCEIPPHLQVKDKWNKKIKEIMFHDCRKLIAWM